MNTKKILLLLPILPLLFLGVSCEVLEEIEARSKIINKFEVTALNLAKDNRILKSEVSQLSYQIEQLKAQNDYLQLQLDKNKGRTLASLPPVNSQNDLVKFNVYRWKAKDLLSIGQKEFKEKKFEKSFQFFQTFINHYPDHKLNNDEILFKTGLAAYETHRRYGESIKNLERIINEYPTSQYYRGAKLWMAMGHLKIGNKDKFFSTVEEFRKKYRNTPEWKILRNYYEDIVERYK